MAEASKVKIEAAHVLSRDRSSFFFVDADTELTYNISMADDNKKLTESEEIDMILYGKVIDRSDWVYTTESEEYERLSEEE